VLGTGSIWPISVGRSDCLFAGSLRAGQRAAAVINLPHSARLNGHEPHAYLKDVRKQVPTQPANRIAELRPHRWQPSAATCSKSHAVVNTGSPRAYERSTNQKEILMLKTITATYASKTTVANVVDELVNDGIPREKIYSDDTTMQVKVMVPETGVLGIEEILNRHEPTSIS